MTGLRRVVVLCAPTRALRSPIRVQKINFALQCRHMSGAVDEDSWAAHLLEKHGKDVAKPQASRPEVELNMDILNKPSEKVQKLIDECCKLTVLEGAMLKRHLAVSKKVHFHC
jgi:hypothetical protein